MKKHSLLMLLLPFSPVCHAEAPAAIRPCVECHGETGIAAAPKTPHLNGQLPEGLVTSMERFIDGRRATTVAQHKAFPPGEINIAAAYYAAQGVAGRPAQQLDPAIVAKGEALYLDRCADCHPDGGRESDKEAPLMAAQDRDYLTTEGLKFKTGARKFAFKMDDAYRGLSDDDLKAIAEFFAAQPAVVTKKKRRH